MTNTTTDTDFLNELAQPAKVEDNTEHPATAEVGPDTAVEAPDTADDQKYKNVLESREDGANTDDLLTVTEFANRLTVRNITEKGMGADGVVDKANIYTAMRAARNPLPVVLVGEAAWLPAFEVAAEAWDARPARGEGTGTGTGGKLSDDDLKRLSWKSFDNVAKLAKRKESLDSRIAKAEKLAEKRRRQLAERNISEADVEEFAAANEETINDEVKDTDSDSE